MNLNFPTLFCTRFLHSEDKRAGNSTVWPRKQILEFGVIIMQTTLIDKFVIAPFLHAQSTAMVLSLSRVFLLGKDIVHTWVWVLKGFQNRELRKTFYYTLHSISIVGLKKAYIQNLLMTDYVLPCHSSLNHYHIMTSV